MDMLHTRRTGLTPPEVAARRTLHGSNVLAQRRRRGALAILLHQFRSLVVGLLALAAAVSLILGDRVEALAILVVLIMNATIGFVSEWRAARSMEALLHLAQAQARVLREGASVSLDARMLVPGDIVALEAGEVVTADLRLIEAEALTCDESVLTGESLPVEKHSRPLPLDTPLVARSNTAFRGAHVTRGTGLGIVCATGMATEVGRITALVDEAEPASPLETRLDALGARLIWLMSALCLLAVGAGLLRGYPLPEILRTSVALAIAAVPEGLPVVATASLARGMTRMLRRNALVRRLSAVQSLGAATLILTDKTGTLTENRMKLSRILLPLGDVAAEDSRAAVTLRLAGLASDAAADPMDAALVEAAERAGLGADVPAVTRHPFDAERRMTAQIFAAGSGVHVVVKGAPEAVLAACTFERTETDVRPLVAEARANWADRVAEAGSEGLRLIGLAEKTGQNGDDPWHGLTLVALMALSDPLRSEVPDAIKACRRAGIRVVMVTGDHAATAARIACEAGIAQQSEPVLDGEALARDLTGAETFPVLARVPPEVKMALVEHFQRKGEVVAMTGDGVNDAPALARADIGIAMGHRGTQVARETADIILLDDAFPTIVEAVREGRIIFDNIRKFIVYLMACNLSEVLVVGFAVAAGLPMPLMPLQILFLNLVTDVFPAFALGLGPGSDRVLDRPPRLPSEPLITSGDWHRVAVLGLALTAAVLAAFVAALYVMMLEPGEAVTVAFVTLSLSQLWALFLVRRRGSNLWRGEEMRNPFVLGAIGLCLALLAVALGWPGLARLLTLPFPGWPALSLAVGASLVPLVAGTVVLSWRQTQSGLPSGKA
ncbi:cation-translocating P-type ATPase [Sagittula sp. M10.9X]|uniref:P-type Cu(+) transporter n=2 Tax=Sagittula salina TaxID=2820268 RepID=A0A940MNU6_9RHOB|nr:cation-translocating P-type ATPase [Sagittula salina]